MLCHGKWPACLPLDWLAWLALTGRKAGVGPPVWSRRPLRCSATTNVTASISTPTTPPRTAALTLEVVLNGYMIEH